MVSAIAMDGAAMKTKTMGDEEEEKSKKRKRGLNEWTNRARKLAGKQIPLVVSNDLYSYGDRGPGQSYSGYIYSYGYPGNRSVYSFM